MRSALLLLLAISGCAKPAPDPFATAKREVAYKLRDPESAQFRALRQKPRAICGEVNGKNEFGGYAGFEPFVYVENAINHPEPLRMDGGAHISSVEDGYPTDDGWRTHDFYGDFYRPYCLNASAPPATD